MRGRVPLALAALLTVAASGPKREGEITLDAAMPVVEAEVNGVRLRLRVDLDQRDTVELNPDAAARIGAKLRPGYDAVLGGLRLPGQLAPVTARIGGRKVKWIVTTHGRACCEGVDGALDPLRLPYRTVRFTRAGPAYAPVRYAMTEGMTEGLLVAQPPVSVQLSLGHRRTVASRAAGVLLAERHGGRFAGPYGEAEGSFGVMRPARPVAFADPPVLLGFTVPSLLMRTADFGGGMQMPEERPAEGDIVVARTVAPQRAWAIVVIGRDYLEGCTEIAFHADIKALDLACDFTRRPPADAQPAGGSLP